MKNLVIVGAGGFGREVLQYVQDCAEAGQQVTVRGFIDDNPEALSGSSCKTPIISSISDYQPDTNDECVIALGFPELRFEITRRLKEKGARFASIIHPSAVVANSATLGQGSIVCPFTFLGPDVVIGEQVLLNTYASVGHDGRVGDYSVLCPYAVLNGFARIEERVFMGTHATITPGMTVAARSKIGGGAVVLSDIPADVLAVGVPAKVRH